MTERRRSAWLSATLVFSSFASSLYGGSIEADVIGSWPADVIDVAVSADCDHVAYITHGANSTAWVDGKNIASAASIESISLSQDGIHYGYFLQDGSNAFAIVDGIRGPAFDELFRRDSQIVFSASGKHVAYMGWQQKKAKIILDSNFLANSWSPFTFAGPAESFYYLEEVNRGDNNMERWVFAGKPQTSYRTVYPLIFSRNGGHNAYVAVISDSEQTVVTDGHEGPHYLSVNTIYPAFSNNGQHLAYLATRRSNIGPNQTVIVLDQEEQSLEGAFWDKDSGPTVAVSDDGKHVAFSSAHEHPFVRFPSPQPPEGQSYTYSLWRDGKKSGNDIEYSFLANLIFSSNGTLAYCVRDQGEDNNWNVVSGETISKPYLAVTPPVFSSDGKHLVYAAKKGEKWIMVLDGSEITEFTAVIPDVFPVDPERIGGRRSPYAMLPYRFALDGKLHFIGIRNGQVFRLQYKP